MDRPTLLSAARNALGSNFSKKGEFRSAFQKLSASEVRDFIEQIANFQDHAALNAEEMDGAAFVGLSNPVFTRPDYWRVSYVLEDFKHRFGHSILRALLYSERVVVLLEDLRWHSWAEDGSFSDYHFRNTQERVSEIFETLFMFSPFIDSHVLLLQPEQIFDVETGSSDFGGRYLDSPLGRLAQTLTTDEDLRCHLERVDRFSEDIEESMSESQYIIGMKNKEEYQYWLPTAALLEDQAFQVLNGTSLLSYNDVQFDSYMSIGEQGSKADFERTWVSSSLRLPEIARATVQDICAIRESERVFSEWRAAITSASMKWRGLVQTNGEINSEFMTEVFDHEMASLRSRIEAEVSNSRFNKVFEGSAVSFGAGAIASASVLPDPKMAIAVGGLSAALKLSYDIAATIKKKIKSPNRVILKYIPLSRQPP